MIGLRKELYGLGNLTDLFVAKYRTTIPEISKAEYAKRLENILFGEGAHHQHSSLRDRKARYWQENFRFYTEVLASHERIFQAYGLLWKFPRYRYYNFFGINELAWIRYHIEFYLQENYILNLRTINWLKYLQLRAKRKSNQPFENLLTRLLARTDKVFENIDKIRGQHVHMNRFAQKDIISAETATFLISRGGLKKMTPLMNLTLSKISIEWRGIVKKNTQSMVSYFGKLFGSLAKIMVLVDTHG